MKYRVHTGQNPQRFDKQKTGYANAENSYRIETEEFANGIAGRLSLAGNGIENAISSLPEADISFLKLGISVKSGEFDDLCPAGLDNIFGMTMDRTMTKKITCVYQLLIKWMRIFLDAFCRISTSGIVFVME